MILENHAARKYQSQLPQVSSLNHFTNLVDLLKARIAIQNMFSSVPVYCYDKLESGCTVG
jgi:hypothetical protein